MISRLLKKAHVNVTQMYKEAKPKLLLTENHQECRQSKKCCLKLSMAWCTGGKHTSLPSPDSNEELAIKLLT